MKKKYLTLGLVATISASMMLSSCVGKFQLTDNLLQWNKTLSSKFVNELVFVAFWILPVYEVSALADLLVINSIEFWSGKNPVAKGTYRVTGSDNVQYTVKCDGKGYTVINPIDNSQLRFDFDNTKQSWSVNVDGRDIELFTFVDDTHVRMPMPDGSYKIVETSQEGVYAYQTAVALSDYAINL